MIRGTTAQFKFNLTYALGDLQWVVMQFWQPGNNGTTDNPLPIIKKRTTLSGTSTELLVTLTSEETLRFTDKLKARVQLRAQTKTGLIFASHQELVTVYPLPGSLITDEVIQDPTDDGYDDDWTVVLDGGSIA